MIDKSNSLFFKKSYSIIFFKVIIRFLEYFRISISVTPNISLKELITQCKDYHKHIGNCQFLFNQFFIKTNSHEQKYWFTVY